MHQRLGRELEAQDLAGGQRRQWVVEAPDRVRRADLLDEIAAGGGLGHVEDPPVGERAQQLDVLRMGPDERHRRPRGAAAEELELRQILGIPHLLGDEVAVACEPLHRGEEPLGLRRAPGGELVMRALAGEERPGPPDPGAVEGRTILVLAVAVVVVAPPARA